MWKKRRPHLITLDNGNRNKPPCTLGKDLPNVVEDLVVVNE